MPSLAAGERVEVTVRKKLAHPHEALRGVAGTMSDDDAREMLDIIEAEFERVNPSEWK